MKTNPGLPRPIVDSKPLPYVSQAQRQGTVDLGRYRSCLANRLCGICGIRIGDSEQKFIASNLNSLSAQPRDIAIDNKIIWMHHKCAKLARAHCPFLSKDHVIIYSTPKDLDEVLTWSLEDFMKHKL